MNKHELILANQEQINAAVLSEKEFICEKIKEFAMFKCELTEHLKSSVIEEELCFFTDLLSEIENNADTFYTDLLSIYGILVEKEVSHE